MASKSLGDLIIRIMGENSSFSNTLKQSEQSLKSFSDKAVSIGKTLSLAITAPLLLIGTAAVKSASDIETLQASFSVLLGDGAKATKLLAEIKQFAGVTPFETKDLAESAKILLQFGINSEAILPTLKTLGDISLGDSEKLKQLSLVFGQITSTGRLMGQDLLQLINAGFNPLSEISKKTGESIATLKDRMEKGGIGALEVAEAFKSATAAGGQFYEGTKKLGETFAGKLSTLKDDATTLAMSFAELLLPTLKNLVKSLSDAVSWFTNLDQPTKEMILQMGLVAASIGPLIGIVGSLGTALSFLAANPVILAIAAIAGLAIGIVYLNKQHERNVELLNKTVKAVYENRDASHALLDPIIAEGKNRKLTGDEIDRLIKIYPNLTKLVDRNSLTAQDATKLAELQANQQVRVSVALLNQVNAEEQLAKAKTQRRIDELEELSRSKQFSQRDKDNALAEVKTLEGKKLLTDQIVSGNNAQIKSLLSVASGQEKYVATTKQAVDITTGMKEATTAATKETEKFFDSMAADEETQTQNIDGWNGRYEAIQKNIEAEKEATEAIKKTKEEQSKAKAEFDQFISIATQFSGQLKSIFSGIFDLQKAEVDQWANDQLAAQGLAHDDKMEKLQVELDAAIAAGDTEKSTAVKNDIARAKIDEEATKRKKKILHDEAVANKAFAIADIIIKTAQAVAAALTIPLAGPALAIANGVLGAAQLAIAAAQPIPEFADGGIVPATQGGRIIRVAEAGQAEAIIPLSKINQFSGGDGNVHLVVNLDSRPFLDKIFPATKNRTILIDQGALV